MLSVRNNVGRTPLECHREELEELRMELIVEQMAVVNGSETMAKLEERIREPPAEMVADVERLQHLVQFLQSAAGPQDGGDAKVTTADEDQVDAEEVIEATSEEEAPLKTPPPPSP